MDRKYAMILGNLGNTHDRFCNGYKNNPTSTEMLKSVASIPHVQGIELVGTWDIHPGNVKEMKTALADLNLKCISIIPDLFGDPDYAFGSYNHFDARIRRKAIDYTRQMCDIAGELNCPCMNLWPGQDGYDYLLCTDYLMQREWECQAVIELATAYPDLRFALEYKPREPRTHSTLATMADTLLLAQETGCPNVGVTIDTGHAFAAAEVVGASIVLAKRAGDKLFHMHFNDNHGVWDDDMIVGSVHSICYLEMLYWLDKCGYDGWFSMDQYPYREDAASAIGESILWLCQFDEVMQAHRQEIDALVQKNDAVATSRFLRSVML